MLGASLSPLYLELRISIGRIGMSLSCQLREIEVLAGRLVPGAQLPMGPLRQIGAEKTRAPDFAG
jgi:hypothetical protein